MELQQVLCPLLPYLRQRREGHTLWEEKKELEEQRKGQEQEALLHWLRLVLPQTLVA